MPSRAKTLSEVRDADRQVVGGKAYNCARLLAAGFPVPDGVVVPADLSDDEITTIPQHRWFDAQPGDALYAVRSSGIEEDTAGHSFAGIHDTQLNVGRDGLVEAVLACRRSGQSAHAAEYRRTRRIEESAGPIAVLVQRMVPATASGVAFTVNPVSGADDLVINAAPGLGEALVSGRIDPDEFVVRKNDLALTSTRIGASRQLPTLSPDQIADLGRLLLRVERFYRAPQDIEFCHDGRQFWIVQSRPITTTPTTTAPGTRHPHPAPGTGTGTQHEAPGTSTQHPAPSTRHPNMEPEWTRANLAEVLPEQTSPQVIDAYEDMLNKGQRKYMGRLLAPYDELGPMFKAFHGRMYMNLSQMRRVVWLAGAPAADLLRSLGHAEQIHPEDERPHRAPFREIVKVLADFIRLAINDARAAALFSAHQQRTRETMARMMRVADPSTLSDRDVWDMFDWWIRSAPDAIQVIFVMTGVLFRETRIRRACEAVGYPYERLLYTHLAAGPRSVSSQEAIELVALAALARSDARAHAYLLAADDRFTDFRAALTGSAFLERFEQFLDEYGHRGRFESDWSLPRLHEDPAPALFAIREQLKAEPQDIDALTRRQEKAAADAWSEFAARASWWQRLTLLPRVRAMLRRLKQQYVWREQVRSDLTRVVRYARVYHLTLADRFVARGWLARREDYFLIRLQEIAAVVADPSAGSGLRAIAARRREHLDAERDLDLPLLMRESELPRLMRQGHDVVVAVDADLTGLCVSRGSVEAEVVVMRDPAEFSSMKRGAILVTRATDPSWTPLFTLASGVIVEVGGVLSHASTIAREYGLPALANVKDATRLLRTGERVRLDASGGRVIRISAPTI